MHCLRVSAYCSVNYRPKSSVLFARKTFRARIVHIALLRDAMIQLEYRAIFRPPFFDRLPYNLRLWWPPVGLPKNITDEAKERVLNMFEIRRPNTCPLFS